MIKNICLIIICLFSALLSAEAQSLLYKIPIENQVEVSTLIVEGEVVSKKSYFSSINNHIYTVHKIKVYRAFKGDIQEYVNLVTKGGSIGLKREEIKPNIQLSIGDMGVFMLEDDSNEFVDFESELKNYYAYSNLQGFYKYDKFKNTVTNPYYIFSGIQTSFYEQLESMTSNNIELLDFDFPFERQGKSLATTVAISSFSPEEIRAGIGESITITGTDFGNEIGFVLFRDSDSSFGSREAFDSAIQSWSNTEIVINVPSFAGTGRIEVITIDGDIVDSSEDLIVLSSELNAEFGAIPGVNFRPKLFNSDNQGGYTWTYNEEFFENAAAVASFERSIDSWVCTTRISWLIDEDLTNIRGTDDEGLNVVSFVGGSENTGEIQAGILAVTTTYYQGCQDGDGVISYASEIDMTFNSDFDWYFDEDTSNIGLFQNDFQGTATHELGHAHNLGHVIAPTNLMHFETSSGIESATREIDENSEIGASLSLTFSKIRDSCVPRFIVDRDCLDDSTVETDNTETIFTENPIASIENPVGDFLIVRLRDLNALSYSFHVYNMNGQEEFFDKLTTIVSDPIDVRSLSSGLYIVMIVVDTDIYIKKIIKE